MGITEEYLRILNRVLKMRYDWRILALRNWLIVLVRSLYRLQLMVKLLTRLTTRAAILLRLLRYRVTLLLALRLSMLLALVSRDDMDRLRVHSKFL